MTRQLAWRQRRIDAGLCGTCGKVRVGMNPSTGKPFIRCLTCRLRHQAYLHKRSAA